MKTFTIILTSIAIVLAGLGLAALLTRRTATSGDILAGITFAVVATIVFLACHQARRNRP